MLQIWNENVVNEREKLVLTYLIMWEFCIFQYMIAEWYRNE